VVARAVAELPVLLEYALPFCRRGGMLLAQKGEAASAEAIASERALAILAANCVVSCPLKSPAWRDPLRDGGGEELPRPPASIRGARNAQEAATVIGAVVHRRPAQ